HRLPQSIRGGDKHDLIEARFGVQRKHHTARTQVAAHHALNAGRQSHLGMREALVHAVGNGAVVVERSEDVLDGVEQVVDAVNVQVGFLLPGEGGIGQVFGGGG